MSGKTARRLRKERERGADRSIQTKAVGAAAAAMIAMTIAPGVALAEGDATVDTAVDQPTVAAAPAAEAPTVAEGTDVASEGTDSADTTGADVTASEPAPVVQTVDVTPVVVTEAGGVEAAEEEHVSNVTPDETVVEQKEDVAEEHGVTPVEEGDGQDSVSTEVGAARPLISSVADELDADVGEAPAQKEVAAKIGDVEYESVDDAIAAANDESHTIELQQGASALRYAITKAFDKDVTFTGNGTLTMDVYGWYFRHVLTLDGKGVTFNVTSDENAFDGIGENQKWLILCLGGEIHVINGASMDFTFDSNNGTNDAIYMDENATRDIKVVVDNGSTFTVHGRNTQGKTGQGVQLGKTANSGIYVTGGSTFLIDGTNRGYVNSPTVYVKDSTLTVQNCSSNASNGGTFTAINSQINFLNNGGHGLSAGDTTFENSSLISTGNGYTGVHIGGNLDVTNSNLTIKGNGWNTWDTDRFAGLRIDGNGIVDASSTVDIEDNYEVGLRIQNTTSDIAFAEGSSLILVNNGLARGSEYSNDYYTWTKSEGFESNTLGGGIWNRGGTLVLPANAVIYNNNATTAGDDIYSTGTVTFGVVGSDWYLDGEQNNKCVDLIDGWYDDSNAETVTNAGSYGRWNAHPENGSIHTLLAAGGTYTGDLAIKAAHAGVSDVKVGKKATNLDENNESEVTLEIPAAEEPLTSDVVFVLDKSTSAESEEQILATLQHLRDQIKGSDTKVKVGVVIFNKDANTTLELTELNDANYDAIEKAIKTEINSGTNLDAGIEAGTKLLDDDTLVAAKRKYLVVISDGITYMFDSDGDTADGGEAINLQNGDKTSAFPGPDNWETKYGNNEAPSSWADWIATIGKQIQADGGTYVEDYGQHNTYIPFDARSEHASSVDRALYESYESYQAASAKYHTFALTAGTGSGAQYVWGPSFMRFLAGGKEVSFQDIENQVLYIVGKGSKVRDDMGSGSYSTVEGKSYDIDFVDDASALSIESGSEVLKAEKLETEDGDTSTYGFGKLDDGTYRYVLHYHAMAPDEDASYTDDVNDYFVLDINENVTIANPLKVHYTVRLANGRLSADKTTTFGAYDEDGSKAFADIMANAKATLYPVDSEGNTYAPVDFPKPTLSYTVEAEEPTPTPTPTPAVTESEEKAPETSARLVKAQAKVAKASVPRTGDSMVGLVSGLLAAIGLGILGVARLLRRRSES